MKSEEYAEPHALIKQQGTKGKNDTFGAPGGGAGLQRGKPGLSRRRWWRIGRIIVRRHRIHARWWRWWWRDTPCRVSPLHNSGNLVTLGVHALLIGNVVAPLRL